MADIHGADAPAPGDLSVRAPRQKRTREQWDRILDAGVLLLEDGGYEAFTIAALCERAEVPPRALYARAATKDALFLAVYEHGMGRVALGERAFTEPRRWAGLDRADRVEQAVRLLVGIFVEHEALLRSVVLISGAHEEVRRRGEAYRTALGEQFAGAVLGPGAAAAEVLREAEFCFSMVFSAMVLRTAYGPGFGPRGAADSLADELVVMARRYLRVDG